MRSTDSKPEAADYAGKTTQLGLNAASLPDCHSAYAKDSGKTILLALRSNRVRYRPRW